MWENGKIKHVSSNCFDALTVVGLDLLPTALGSVSMGLFPTCGGNCFIRFCDVNLFDTSPKNPTPTNGQNRMDSFVSSFIRSVSFSF